MINGLNLYPISLKNMRLFCLLMLLQMCHSDEIFTKSGLKLYFNSCYCGKKYPSLGDTKIHIRHKRQAVQIEDINVENEGSDDLKLNLKLAFNFTGAAGQQIVKNLQAIRRTKDSNHGHNSNRVEDYSGYEDYDLDGQILPYDYDDLLDDKEPYYPKDYDDYGKQQYDVYGGRGVTAVPTPLMTTMAPMTTTIDDLERQKREVPTYVVSLKCNYACTIMIQRPIIIIPWISNSNVFFSALSIKCIILTSTAC